jgi:hypothetical protein
LEDRIERRKEGRKGGRGLIEARSSHGYLRDWIEEDVNVPSCVCICMNVCMYVYLCVCLCVNCLNGQEREERKFHGL